MAAVEQTQWGGYVGVYCPMCSSNGHQQPVWIWSHCSNSQGGNSTEKLTGVDYLAGQEWRQLHTSTVQHCLFDSMDPIIMGFISPHEKLATLIIQMVLALGGRTCAISHVKTQKQGKNFTSYDIWISGLLPEVFCVVDQKDQKTWDTLLSASRGWKKHAQPLGSNYSSTDEEHESYGCGWWSFLGILQVCRQFMWVLFLNVNSWYWFKAHEASWVAMVL